MKFLLELDFPVCVYKFLFTNLHKSTQGKPQKSMRPPILIRFPCYSKSFTTTFEEESLTNQAKRDYDFTAATVKYGFQGTKMVDNWGGVACVYIYMYLCIYLLVFMYCIYICIYVYIYKYLCIYVFIYLFMRK